MAVVGTRVVVVGRATCSFASGIPSSLRSLALRPSTSPRTSCSPISFQSAAPQTQCRRAGTCSWGGLPPNAWRSSVVAFSSSSPVSSVETSGIQAAASSSSGEELGTGSPAAASPAVEVDALDIRVGRVLKAWKHPEADSLYVEEVDLAEPEGPRIICSGLVNFLSLEELEGRAVVVLANLKARNMRGLKSNGMLLAASNSEHTTVQLLSPPEGAVLGERVWFGEEADQANQTPAGTPNQVQKKKIWESIQPLLKTTEDCIATFQSKPMRTSMGVVTCESLQGANIS